MPVLENDALVALVNRADHWHPQSRRLFERIAAGEWREHRVAGSAYLEFELVHRGRALPEGDVRAALQDFGRVPHLGEAPLTREVLVSAMNLRGRAPLDYFDSLHAATALASDGIIISTDEIYGKVEGLVWRDLRKV